MHARFSPFSGPFSIVLEPIRRRPESIGFVEWLHRTLLDERLRIIGREKFYDSIEAMQKDLVTYNTKRPHQVLACEETLLPM